MSKIQNSIDNSAFLDLFGLGLSGVNYVNVFHSNISSGDVDLYTVPAGKKAFIYNFYALNPTGASNLFAEIKVSSTYYRIGNTLATSTTAGANIPIGAAALATIILEAGDVFAVNASASGSNVSGVVIEFDDTTPIKSPRVLGLANGDNTLYTVTSGKTAMVLHDKALITTFSNKAPVTIFNGSGATRTYNFYVVPNGGSSGTSNKIRNSVTLNNNTANSFITGGAFPMQSGDFLVVNSNSGTAGQNAWVNVIEV